MATQTTPQSLAADAKKQLATNKRRGQSLLALTPVGLRSAGNRLSLVHPGRR